MPAYKRKYSKYGGSTKYARTSGTYRKTGTRLMAARKGAKLGYRKGGYSKSRRTIGVGTNSYKFTDTTALSSPCITTGNLTLLGAVGQGTDENQRLGRNTMMKSIQFKGELQAGATNAQSIARVILLYDRQPNKAAPVMADILTSVTYNAFRNLDNKDRFVILMDKMYSVIGPGGTGVSTESVQRAIDKYIKLPNLLTNYTNSGTGTSADITTGSLWLFTLGDQSTASLGSSLNYYARVRFVDV